MLVALLIHAETAAAPDMEEGKAAMPAVTVDVSPTSSPAGAPGAEPAAAAAAPGGGVKPLQLGTVREVAFQPATIQRSFQVSSQALMYIAYISIYRSIALGVHVPVDHAHQP